MDRLNRHDQIYRLRHTLFCPRVVRGSSEGRPRVVQGSSEGPRFVRNKTDAFTCYLASKVFGGVDGPLRVPDGPLRCFCHRNGRGFWYENYGTPLHIQDMLFTVPSDTVQTPKPAKNCSNQFPMPKSFTKRFFT